MIKKNLIHSNFILNKHLNSYKNNFSLKKVDRIFKEIKNEIRSKKQTLNILNKDYKFNLNFSELNRFKKFKTIAIIGMGGSILGAEAIHQFLKHKIKKKIYFFNNLDSAKIMNIKNNESLNKVLFIVISKSGNTVETISNFLSLNIIKKKSKNIIIISEKKNNLLFNLSKKNEIYYIEHNPFIGGRYSVLSEVGIVPAYIMGINIIKLRKNIRKFLEGNFKKYLKKSSIKLTNILNSKKKNNIIFLNYSPKLEKMLFWTQQLIAESLGKKNQGFLPVISNVPKDHHSLLQLYLDGPKDKIFYIFSLDDNSKIKVNLKNFNYENNINKKNIETIKNAQKSALIKLLKKKKIPFREFKIKAINEEVLGEIFAYFMLETVIIGKLTKINPFDQPAVEQVKIYTKKLLKQ